MPGDHWRTLSSPNRRCPRQTKRAPFPKAPVADRGVGAGAGTEAGEVVGRGHALETADPTETETEDEGVRDQEDAANLGMRGKLTLCARKASWPIETCVPFRDFDVVAFWFFSRLHARVIT